MKSYIIQEINQEYNDEWYSVGDGGTPIRVYLNKEKAIQEALELTFAKIKDTSLNDYSDWARRGFKKEFDKLFDIELEDEDIEDYEFTLPKDITLEQYKALSKYIDIQFYEVVECQLDEDFSNAEILYSNCPTTNGRAQAKDVSDTHYQNALEKGLI